MLVAQYVEKSAIYYHAFLHQVRKINAKVSNHALPPIYPRRFQGTYLI